MPAGMQCSGSVGGATNVCIVRLKNGAGAGPFGGSAAFTNPTTAGTTTAGTAGTAGTASAEGTAPQSTVLSNTPPAAAAAAA